MVKMFARYGTTPLPDCQANKEQMHNLHSTIYNFKYQHFIQNNIYYSHLLSLSALRMQTPEIMK